MKKIFFYLLVVIFFILSIFLIALSTIGIKTDRFNNLISNKINQSNKDITINLSSINFKLDVKEISLFLETLEPNIEYRDVIIPAKNIKVYIDFISLLKSTAKIEKINISLKQLDITQVKKLSLILKPSNLKSLINNKIQKGKLLTNVEIFLDEKNSLKNFIARGFVSDFSLQVSNEVFLENMKFSFFADKSDILIKNIFGKLDGIELKDGDVKLNLSPKISINSNFLTIINLDSSRKNKYIKLFPNLNYYNDLKNAKLNLNNNLSINFDNTYKVENYNFTSSGTLDQARFKFKEKIKNDYFGQDINELFIQNSEINSKFSSDEKSVNIFGKYSLNNKNFLNYKIKNTFDKEVTNLELDIEYDKQLNFDFINYQNNENSTIDLSLILKKKKNSLEIKKFNLRENKNNILVDNIILIKNKISSFKKISVVTYKNGRKNNDFTISFGKKIYLKGTDFDATNLAKFFNRKESKNSFSNISKEVEIDIANTTAPLSKNLKNFKLIGQIDKGKFVKINAKGDFGNNKFLDISMKNDRKSKKKYLEIYSDLPQPLLTQFSFFKGLSGGTLLFKSIIHSNNSNSNLKIENFKLVNAPGVVKLLSLADLGGLADLTEGEGLSFDTLEIKIENNDEVMRLNEIFAVGPSISVLMEGYKDKNNITSLRGTLIPAKNLNKLISKIPVLGEIIIPKEVGEGLFGISFKMKGPPGKIKTTINPIKTLTPRFIQKIIEKNKSPK